ncbi:MAG: ADOP family duplicated permease [Acidobacteriota bacterium]
MGWLSELSVRLRALVDRRRFDAELEEELRHHLDLEIESLIERGLEPAEARRQARIHFGGTAAVREECKEERGVSLIENLARDLRFGARTLRREPRFAAAALGSLALGVGATTLLFAVLHAVLLRPLPYERSAQLVDVSEITPKGDLFSVSDLNVLDLRERATQLQGVAAWPHQTSDLRLETGNGGEATRLTALEVTGNFFRVLGLEPRYGRSWSDEETARGTRARSVVLSHAVWQQSFAADEEAVGRDVMLNGETWTILGVLPPVDPYGPRVDVWVPYTLDLERDRGDHRLGAIARIAEDASIESASAEAEAIFADLAQKYPEDQQGWSVRLRSFDEVLFGGDVSLSARALSVAVALLLLLACSNVSSLLLARGARRVPEVELRSALGAPRSRLIQQLLAESVALGLAGGLAGLLVATLTLPVVRVWAAGALPRVEQAAIDPVTASVALAAGAVAAMLFGTLPALRQTQGVKATRSRSIDPREGRWRATLVVAQLALALVLTCSSLVLLHSLDSLRAVPLGFAPEGLVAVDVQLPLDRYPEGSEGVWNFFERLVEEVRAVPGVESAAGNATHPFRGPGLANSVAPPEVTELRGFTEVAWRTVTSGSFRTQGVPLLQGRDFREDEPELVTIVSAELASRLFPEGNAIGEELQCFFPGGPVVRIIGIAGDVRDMDVSTEPEPMYYWWQGHSRWPGMTVLVRSDLSMETLAGPLRAAVAEVDPLLPPPEVRAVEDSLRETFASPRLNVRLFGVFAGLALAIAAGGLYGLLAYAAARRRSEIGVRIALGATQSSIRHLLLRDGLRLVVGGTVLGLLLFLAASRLLDRLLFETTPMNPQALASSVGLFVAVGLLGCLLPTRQATRQDPAESLRAES